MLPQQKQEILIPKHYVEMERKSEIKNEYFNGEIFAMADASREHNQISSNLVMLLSAQLLDKPCSVYSSDMKVKIEQVNKYTYPDVLITCEKEEFEDKNTDILLNPIVILEILSDSTEAYDRGAKFFHYQFINSFVEYLLISQKFCRVEKFERQKNNVWIYSEFHSMDDIIKIKSTDCSISLKDIYRRVILKEQIV